jgi:hypothetical protein
MFRNLDFRTRWTHLEVSHKAAAGSGRHVGGQGTVEREVWNFPSRLKDKTIPDGV